jgi:uroporphyrin-III C-methyltransferase
MIPDPKPADSVAVGELMGASPEMPASVNASAVKASQWPRGFAMILMVAVVVAWVAVAILWQRLNAIQEQLARQSADISVQAIEARGLSRQASDLSRETAARLAVNEARLSEATLQRTQLEELMQSLSRSRDENLVVDIESAVRLAQQQAQLTGSVEPLIAALKSADQRVQRAAQPRLANLQRAIARDLGRIQATALSDTPALLVKLDELARAADDLPLANAVGDLSRRSASAPAVGQSEVADAPSTWWQELWMVFKRESRGLVRVSRVEQPEAALLSPEQAFFVRENLKLKILNARLGLLARQLESARSDLATASATLPRYFDMSSRKTQNSAALMAQVQAQMRVLELPRVDETLAALATAAAGR